MEPPATLMLGSHAAGGAAAPSAASSVVALRMTIGVVLVWFGALKFFAHRSPAEDLTVRTVRTLSFEILSRTTGRRAIASLECLVGIGLIAGRPMKPTLLLFGLQLAGALSPLVIFPRRLFRRPWQPTLEGQYVVKDIVLVAAAMVLGAAHRSQSAPAVGAHEEAASCSTTGS